MASKSPNRHWKTADWKASGQLKTLEKEQADLLKSFSRHLNELEGYLTQNKTMTAESAYRCFFRTYDDLEDNRQQQRLLLKPKYSENFDNDTKRMLEEKKKVLRWVVDKIPDLQDIEDCRAVVVDYRKYTLRWYKLWKDANLIEHELGELEKKLKSENLSNSERQILCDQMERLLEKLDEIYAEALRILNTEGCPDGFANFSKTRSQYQDLINQYRFSKDCGNQTSLVSTTSAGDKDPNDETVIDTGNGAIENSEENAEVSSKSSATHGNRKQPSIANSRSSRRRQIEETELENLRAKTETEQQLRERQLELEQEREEIELRRQQEELRLQQQQQQQEQELRLRMQQQEDELRFRQHERALENERRKAEEEEEQRRLKLELTKGSSRASGSVADEIESVGSKRNQERIERWAEAGAQQSVPQRPLSPNVVIDPPTNVTKDRADKRFSTYPKTTPLFHPGERLFSTQLTEPSILKKPEVRKSIRVTDPPAPPLTRATFQQQRTSAVQYRNRRQSPNNNFRNRSAESRNRSTMNHTTPQVIYQPVPSSGASGLPKLKLTEFSGDPLEWPEWSGLFDVVVHQKPISDTEKMQYLKTSLTGQAKAAISGMGFSSQSYYHAWDILCEKYGRSDFIVNAQFKKILTHPPVRHDDSTSIVKFANVVTNVVNTLTQLGYTSDLEAEAVLSSTTRKLSPQLREQWLQYMQDRRLLRGNLIIFKEWLASKATIHENLLAQTNSSFDRNKFQSRDKPKTSTFASNAEESSKPKNFECPFKDGQHPIWTCEKFKSLKVNERREHVQKFRLCFNCLKPGHMSKDCRSRTCSVPSCGRRHNRLLHSELPKKETTRNVSDATTAVATNITQGGLPVVRIKLTNRDLSLNVLAMCDSGSSISFVDKSVVSKLHLQGRKASLSVAGIHGSQDVKTEIVPIAVSAHEKSRPLTTVQFYVHEKQKLGDQIVELQELKDRYPHLRNLPDQSYNLNDVQVILGQDCYDIHHPFEFKKSEDKTAPWAVKSKIGWALSGPLPAKQAATLATTATSIADDKLANQFSKWWDIESYASNCDVTGHSKEEQRAIKTLEQTTQFNGERYEVGLLWREDEVKLPNNFYSAMGQLKSLERRLQKDEALKKRYQETIDTDVNAGYVRKVDQAELNETKDKLQWYLPHHPVINPHKPEKVRRVCNAAAKYQGVENPADIGTRGMSIEGLKESAWLNGPAWLQADEGKWPKPWCQVNELEPEQVTSTVATETKLEQLFDWRRYSSFKRIRNFIAYCMRFKTKQKGPLKADEIHQAEQILFRFVQNESFPNVSKSISNSKEISKVLNIAKLSPFIEEDGTIRVKGRLKHSNLDYNAKHPILLTAKHPVVQLLLEKAHRDNLHEGTEYARNMLQQEYWIIGLRNALRKIKSRCIKCRHRNANPIHPPMADLPRERLDEHVFPFTHTGVDYFGPIEVKFLRRTLKRWCCLFTCLTTRAVHIEVAQSLDTESCLAAVTRFIARRGYPSTIISDNGTNFVGAAKELKAFMDEWDKAKIEIDLAQKKIVWKFNPPGAPHFGGIWERLVQSCKKVMIAILDNRSLTDEVLSTTMCLVEQTLNARPLTAVSDDPEDLTALTPNHFLLGRENASAPFMPSSERYHDLRKSFKTAQAYADMIWKRWTREYLPQWNQRSKWSKKHVRNLKEGELVWMVDESVKRCEYKMGRVIQVFKGNDGVVRSARVKMAHGEFNRPVVKLAPVFYDGVSEIENRAGDVGATSEQKHEPSDQQK